MTKTLLIQKKVFPHKPRLVWSESKTSLPSRKGLITLVGESDHRLESFMSKTLLTAVQTEFLFLLALPLIPIRSYRVTIGEITEGYVFEERSHCHDKIKQPLHWRQIGEVYGFVILFWSVFLTLGPRVAVLVPKLVAIFVAKDPSELGYLYILALFGFLLLWGYVLAEIARFVIGRRRYRTVAEQIGQSKFFADSSQSEL